MCDVLVGFNIWQLLILRTEDVCFSANVPEGSLRVVHETWYNHSKWGQGVKSRLVGENSYLRIQLVDFFNGSLDITGVNRSADFNPLLDGFNIRSQLDIGFHCEFLRSSGIAVGDEIIHDQIVDITVL